MGCGSRLIGWGGRDGRGGRGFWPVATAVSRGRGGSQPALTALQRKLPPLSEEPIPASYAEGTSGGCHGDALPPAVVQPLPSRSSWGSGLGITWLLSRCGIRQKDREVPSSSHEGPPHPWEDTARTSLILHPPHATSAGSQMFFQAASPRGNSGPHCAGPGMSKGQ